MNTAYKVNSWLAVLSRVSHALPLRIRYGVSRHLPREEREQRFMERIHTAVARGGRVLLPVVALGRAQELLLILEEYWERHPELHGVPIYQVGSVCECRWALWCFAQVQAQG